MVNKKLLELLKRAEEENAECKTNPDLFFPEDWDIGTTGMSSQARALAKTMCLRCPLKSECLEYALEANEQFGIWGGLTGFERQQITKKTRW